MRVIRCYIAIAICVAPVYRTHLAAIYHSQAAALISSGPEATPVPIRSSSPGPLPNTFRLGHSILSTRCVSALTPGPADLAHLVENLLDDVHARGVKLVVFETG